VLGLSYPGKRDTKASTAAGGKLSHSDGNSLYVLAYEADFKTVDSNSIPNLPTLINTHLHQILTTKVKQHSQSVVCHTHPRKDSK